MKKLWMYAKHFLAHPTNSEINLLIFNVVALVFPAIFVSSWYLWGIVVIADIVTCMSHGAWCYDQACKGNNSGNDRTLDSQAPPWQTPVNEKYRLIALGAICILCFAQEYFGIIDATVSTAIRTYGWYVAVVLAVCEAFRCVLKTMHAADDSWLAGTNGDIGVPNWISIIRIGVALVTPHIYVEQSFGDWSNVIATVVLASAILTDLLDGYIARSTGQITKAGKALDPLGDKFILYPNAAAFVIATAGGLAMPDLLRFKVSIIIAICLTVGRDVLFILWFFLKGKKLKEGIGASLVDKLRMLTICLWIGATAMALTCADTLFGQLMAWVAFGSLLATGALSVISFVVDLTRVNRLVKNQK